MLAISLDEGCCHGLMVQNVHQHCLNILKIFDGSNDVIFHCCRTICVPYLCAGLCGPRGSPRARGWCSRARWSANPPSARRRRRRRRGGSRCRRLASCSGGNPLPHPPFRNPKLKGKLWKARSLLYRDRLLQVALVNGSFCSILYSCMFCTRVHHCNLKNNQTCML